MMNKTSFNGTTNPNFRIYILSQAVKHKNFPYDKYKRKYSHAELDEQMVFLMDHPKHVA